MSPTVKYEYGVVAMERGKTVSITRADNFERVSEEALLQTLSRLGQEGWLVSASMPDLDNPSRQLLIIRRQL